MKRIVAPLSILVVLASVVGFAPVGSAAAAAGLRDAAGLHILSQGRVSSSDPRLLALELSTKALPGPANVDILLPTGYAAHPRRHYPVLYLLPGTGGGAADWTQFGGAEQATAGRPLIVVMPDIALNHGGGGWCSNAFNFGRHGLPRWETFHIDELIPWVDDNLRTIANRDGRAIAGLSQGGFCSTSYPARHPDLFSASLSFSGAPDIWFTPSARGPAEAIINAIEVAYDHIPANSIFGPPATEGINWAAHDPATLANNMRGMDILIFAGNGQRGPLDPAPVSPTSFGAVIENLVGQDSAVFHARLNALGIKSFYDAYGPGTHSFPYWARDLRQSIGPLMGWFAHPPPPSATVTYTAAEDRYTAFGWTVSMRRRAMELSTLERAGAGGFTLTGSGSGTVRTPARYRPGMRYRITLRGRRIRESHTVIADHQGRLQVTVPLGPSNRYQEYTQAALSAGTVVYTTRVLIRPEA